MDHQAERGDINKSELSIKMNSHQLKEIQASHELFDHKRTQFLILTDQKPSLC